MRGEISGERANAPINNSSSQASGTVLRLSEVSQDLARRIRNTSFFSHMTVGVVFLRVDTRRLFALFLHAESHLFRQGWRVAVRDFESMIHVVVDRASLDSQTPLADSGRWFQPAFDPERELR